MQPHNIIIIAMAALHCIRSKIYLRYITSEVTYRARFGVSLSLVPRRGQGEPGWARDVISVRRITSDMEWDNCCCCDKSGFE